MEKADLYIESINLEKYLSSEDCTKCGAHSCKDLVSKLKIPEWEPGKLTSSSKARALYAAAQAVSTLPSVPKIGYQRPGPVGVTHLNNPVDGDPILITGNSEFTQEVMFTVLAPLEYPLFLLCTDTSGDTLDMAIVFKTFNLQLIKKSLEEEVSLQNTNKSAIILPGMAHCLEAEVKSLYSGRCIKTGPVCAAELPLYLGQV